NPAFSNSTNARLCPVWMRSLRRLKKEPTMTDNPLISPAVPEQHKVDVIGLVREDMQVYDRAGKRVGTVDGIYSGASEPAAPAAETIAVVQAAVAAPQPAPLIGAVPNPITHVPEFDDVLEPDEEFPREMRERLVHDGFIRIDAGFLRHHRFALRDQIQRVS